MFKSRTVIFIILFVVETFASSCSKRVLEAMEVHKLHDEYLILRRNGHYSFKILLLGVFRMPDYNRGRYLISGDTVYFVNKTKLNTFSMYGYGIIDRQFRFFFL